MAEPEQGNRKWQGLKLPVGKLFTPKPNKPTLKRDRTVQEQSPTVGNESGQTADTEVLTDFEVSPATTSGGRNSIFGRRRQNSNDDSAHARRRSGGALDILRKSIFSNNKGKSDTPNDALPGAQQISDSVRIDPYFNRNELSSSRRNNAKPPSFSDLSSSVDTYSSRTEHSPTSVKPASVHKIFADTNNPVRSPRPMFSGARAPLPPALGLPLSDEHEDGVFDHTLSQKIRIGQMKMTNSFGTNRPGATTPSIDEGSETSSFYPTLSQKIRIGKLEIEKKLEERKAPLLNSNFTSPATIGDCLPRLDKLDDSVRRNTTSKSLASSTLASKTTVKMSNVAGSSPAPKKTARMSTMVGSVETPIPLTPESSPHSATKRMGASSSRDRPSASPNTRSRGHTSSSHRRRAHHSQLQPTEPSRNNSDSTSGSRGRRGRSGPRGRHDGSPRSPTKHSSVESARSDDGAEENFLSPRRKRSGNKSTSHSRSSNSRSPSRGTHHTENSYEEYNEKARAHSYEPSSPTKQPERRNSKQQPEDEEEHDKRRAHSYDPSSPTKPPERRNSRQRPDDFHDENQEKQRARSHGPFSPTKQPDRRNSKRSDVDHDDYEKRRPRSLDPSSPAKDPERRSSRRPEHSPLHDERKRAKSMDDSMSRQKGLEDQPSKSRHPSRDGRHHHHHHNGGHDEETDDRRERSRTPSHHQRRISGTSRKGGDGSSPSAVRGKRSQSMDDSLSKSSYVDSRHSHRQSQHGRHDTEEEKRARSHTPSHHYRRTDRKHSKGKDESSPRADERKRSKSMDDSLSKSKDVDCEPSDSREYKNRSSLNHTEKENGERPKLHESSRHRNDELGQSRRSRDIEHPEERKRSKSLDESLSSRQSVHLERKNSISRDNSAPEFHDDSSVHLRSKTTLIREENPRALERKLAREPRRNIPPSPHSSKPFARSNQLWDKLAMPDSLPAGLPREKQKVVSKAELARRGELLTESMDCAPSRQRRSSRSPGKYGAHNDGEGTMSSHGSTRRQIRKDIMKNELSNSGRSRHSTGSGRSTSSNRRSRSRSSSHHGRSETPQGRRSSSPGVRTSPKDKWEELLNRSVREINGNDLKPPFASIPSQDRKFACTPAWDPSRKGGDTKILSPSPRPNRGKVTIPPMTPESKRTAFDTIDHSPHLANSQYRAMNKMADRSFKSPLGDPPGHLPGHHSPSQRSRRAPSPLSVISPPLVAADDEEPEPESEIQQSRTSALKNHLRQLEQQNTMNASLRSSTNTQNTNNKSSHSRGNNSSHTNRSSPSRHQRRQRTAEATHTSPRKSQSYGRSSSRDRTVKPSIHHLVPPISDRTEHKGGRTLSPGKTRDSLYGAHSGKKGWTPPEDDETDEIHLPPQPEPTGRTTSSTTKELEQFLKSPRLPGDENDYTDPVVAQTESRTSTACLSETTNEPQTLYQVE